MLANCVEARGVLGHLFLFKKCSSCFVHPVLIWSSLHFLFCVCRFWQARAVESFLRGATSYADQMFLLKRGLLEVNPQLQVGSSHKTHYGLFVIYLFYLTTLEWIRCSFFASIPRQHILFCIIDSGCTSRDVLQSYFDLLGELMKFNIDAFKRFNKYVNTPEKVQQQHAG